MLVESTFVATGRPVLRTGRTLRQTWPNRPVTGSGVA